MSRRISPISSIPPHMRRRSALYSRLSSFSAPPSLRPATTSSASLVQADGKVTIDDLQTDEDLMVDSLEQTASDPSQMYFSKLQRLETRRVHLCTASMVLAVVSILIMVAEYELLWARGGEGDAVTNGLKLSMAFLTSLLLLSIYLFYETELNILKLRNAVVHTESLWSTSSLLLYPFLLECLICIPHPVPFYQADYVLDPIAGGEPLTISTDALGMLMFLRLYLVFRFIVHRSSLHSASARFITALNNIDYSQWFMVKSLANTHPISLLTGSLSATICILAYIFFVLERHASATSTYADSLWFLIVSATTVGYGDISPQSYAGRANAVVGAAAGILISSILVTSILKTSIRITSILTTSILITSFLTTSILNTSILTTSILNTNLGFNRILDKS